MAIQVASRSLEELAGRHGGVIHGDGRAIIRRLVPVERAGAGELAPVLAPRYVAAAIEALGRGARLLVDAKLDVGTLHDAPSGTSVWTHPNAAWALLELLRYADVPNTPAELGKGCEVHPTAILEPRTILGKNVHIGPYAVIGRPGFGFVRGPDGAMHALVHAGGVVLEDDVFVGSHVTIDAGTLEPTFVRRGVKIDSHVHIGHNCDIGAGTVIAAQCGLAGSVVVGRNVLMGGQAGIADHVRIGDGARIAAKSGVIGDVAEKLTVAGYPAVARARWLRGIAELYRDTDPLPAIPSVPPESE
jgi:UDP-3-O-[3-hydroxymyristoyl] glucosamine N-acyltransferase